MASETAGPGKQGEHRTEFQVVGPFAFAGAFARRPAEVREKTAGHIHGGVEQLRGPGARELHRETRLTAGHLMHRVVQNLGRNTPGQGMREIDLVVGIPGVGVERELIGPGLADLSENVPGVEAALDSWLR